MRFVVKKEIFEELLPYREAFRALNILSNIVLNELDWWVASQWENMPTQRVQNQTEFLMCHKVTQKTTDSRHNSVMIDA